jgi:hypothetical protein
MSPVPRGGAGTAGGFVENQTAAIQTALIQRRNEPRFWDSSADLSLKHRGKP